MFIKFFEIVKNDWDKFRFLKIYIVIIIGCVVEVVVIGKISIFFNFNMIVIVNFFCFVSKCLFVNMIVSSYLKFFFCFCIYDERFWIIEDVFDNIFFL